MEEWERQQFDHLWDVGYLADLSGYVQGFCALLWWWTESPGQVPRVIQGGTACLVDTGEARLVVTCEHVLAGLRNGIKGNPTLTCQIANLPFAAETKLIDSDESVDIATFSVDADLPIPRLYKAATWPPAPLLVGDSVTFGGFPKSRREVPSSQTLGSDFVYWLGRVEQASDTHMSLRLDSDKWHWPKGSERLDPHP